MKFKKPKKIFFTAGHRIPILTYEMKRTIMGMVKGLNEDRYKKLINYTGITNQKL